MELINGFTRRKFEKSELYTFSLMLCDNEVDRDFERFSLPALAALEKLFIGKTCIFDHERKSANQTARIFKTQVCTAQEQTEWGEPYTRLLAWAYLPITEKSKELITAIESGILKEVSVSCAVEGTRCSICGKAQCEHARGELYNGKTCHKIFEKVTDAYECSFVAVPAQRAAGVTKFFGEEEKSMQEILTKLKEGKGVSIQAEKACEISSYITALEEKARWGEEYRKELTKEVFTCSALLQPDMPRAVLEAATRHLSVQELKSMAAVYSTMAEKKLPVRPQLWTDKNEVQDRKDNQFKI